MAKQADSASGTTGPATPAGPEPVRRMRRAERRAQILDAATRAFARGGYATTSLDEIATEAGITRVLLHRRFAPKADLYRGVLKRASARLGDQAGGGTFDENSLPALVRAA